MNTEFEATFSDINKDAVRSALKKAGAVLLYPTFLQRRINFEPPKGYERAGSWFRVRQEYGKTTMSYKMITGNSIHDQKEICVTVDDFEQASQLLEQAGCQKKAYQENKREAWKLNGVDITIEEWPFLEPFVEIEGISEQAVIEASSLLGFDYATAYFGAVDKLYAQKYHLSTDSINNAPRIVFEGKNPFLRK